MNSVTLKNISKEYPNHKVISLLNLEVQSNEFLSLLGPSGCGKTTLLRMIAGLEKPSGGSIVFGTETVFDSSQNIFVSPEKRRIGMVFQNYALWPHLSVFKNVAFPLHCQKLSPARIKEKCEEILTQVQLAGFEHRIPNQLSGGQQQRVALARALVAEPRLLLLDEPLSNLDSHLKEEMCELIQFLRRARPVTTIYVTHSQKESFTLSDRICVLNQGKIEQLGTPSDILSKPESEFVRTFMRSSE